MAGLHEPQKVLDRASGQPVAILKNSALVGYLVPAHSSYSGAHRAATAEEVATYLRASQTRVQPVLDSLKDKCAFAVWRPTSSITVIMLS